MKTYYILFLALVFISKSPAQDPSLSGFLSSIPVGSLRDPTGTIHSYTGKLTRPVVIIFSVPSMAQGGNQKSWSEQLASNPKTKLPDSISLFLVEDMKQAGFSDMARQEMKKDYHPGDRPILLLDETGEYGPRFGIPRNSTCVLVYNQANRLVLVEKGKATDVAVEKVRQTVTELLK